MYFAKSRTNILMSADKKMNETSSLDMTASYLKRMNYLQLKGNYQ